MSTMQRSRGLNIRKDDTKRLDEDAKAMEVKLEMLRRTMEVAENSARTGSDGCRWRSGTHQKPIRGNYVKSVLDAPKKSRPRPVAQNAVMSSGRSTPKEATNAETLPSNGGYPAQAVAQEGCFADFLGGVAATQSSIPAAQQDLGNGNKASVNLKNALDTHSKEEAEVEEFLCGLKLDRYVSLFIEHGFDCMDVVLDMNEEHMKDIGMAAGHVIKLQKKIAEMNPSPVASPEPPESGAGGATASQRRVSFGNTEIEPTSKNATSPSSGGGRLLDGQYDEAAAARSFQEAVRAWRTSGEPSSSTVDKSPSSGGGRLIDGTFDEEAASAGFKDAVAAWRAGGQTATDSDDTFTESPAKMAPGSFWSSLGDTEMDLSRVSTPSRAPSEILSAIPEGNTESSGSKPVEEKQACYQCYKQFFTKFAVERSSNLVPGVSDGCGQGDTKSFCSEACASKWEDFMKAKAEAVRKRQEKLIEFEQMQQAAQAEAVAT